MTLHESRAESRIKFIHEYESKSKSDISCDFTPLKAEDPVCYPPYHQAVTRIQEAFTIPIGEYISYPFLTVSHSFTSNISENPYRHTAPCAVLLFGRSASPYYCCLCKSLTKVTVCPSRTTKISRPTIKTGNLGQDLSSTLNSVL